MRRDWVSSGGGSFKRWAVPARMRRRAHGRAVLIVMARVVGLVSARAVGVEQGSGGADWRWNPRQVGLASGEREREVNG
jgi:hypothetical protein